MTDRDDPKVRRVTIDLCDLCLSGAGGECHVPGCALWLNRAPDLSIADRAEEIPEPSGDVIEQAGRVLGRTHASLLAPEREQAFDVYWRTKAQGLADAGYLATDDDGCGWRQRYEEMRAERDHLGKFRREHEGVWCKEGHHTRIADLLGDPNDEGWRCVHCEARATPVQQDTDVEVFARNQHSTFVSGTRYPADALQAAQAHAWQLHESGDWHSVEIREWGSDD